MLAISAPAEAEGFDAPAIDAMRAADVVILGETHDNPVHHTRQAEALAAIAPRAVVYEMLTEAQADRVTPDLARDAAALEVALGWAESGWPDFALYAPIFAAAPEAKVYGAEVPRDAARAVMTEGLAAGFGADAARFGLDGALPEAEQARREAGQQAAHCNALPESMLAPMVDIQRLRDARLAQQTARALAETGGPVAVITGNGHARGDWGMPVYLRRVAPEARVFTLGQGESGQVPEGGFDLVLDSPPVDRPDPCEAFRARGD